MSLAQTVFDLDFMKYFNAISRFTRLLGTCPNGFLRATNDPRSHSVDPRHHSGPVTGEISTRFSTAKLAPRSDEGFFAWEGVGKI